MSSMPPSRFAPFRREDPELGVVKRCTACGEEWPLDTEFYYQHRNKGRVKFYSKCRACWSERIQPRRRAS